MTNATWSWGRNASLTNRVSLTTNGLLTIGQITQSFSLMVTGTFNFNGCTNCYSRADAIPIYVRPTLLVARGGEAAPLRLTLITEPGRPHLLEWTSALRGTNTVWTNLLASNTVFTGGTLVTNLPTVDRQKFFRLKRVVP